MKLSIVAIGKKMPSWVEQGYSEYAKRLPKELSPNLIELPLANRPRTASGANAIKKYKDEEGEAMLAAVSRQHRVIALDVNGSSVGTEQLAKKITNWQMEGQDVSIFIGGPDGLSSACLQRANESWSLSAMTLPHPLVRVVLIEQLYRAWTILARHPYHK